MKKIILTLALAAAAAFGANAQIGVGLGYTQKVHGGDADDTLGGLYVGGTYNIELSNGICVAPGIDLSWVNSKHEVLGVETKVNEIYLGVPVLFNYAIGIADGFKLVPFAGPTFSLGLSSKSKTEGVDDPVNNYDNDDYKRFDVLVGGGVALDVMDLVRVSVGYNYGLLDRDANDSFSDKCSGVHFGVAYLF